MDRILRGITEGGGVEGERERNGRGEDVEDEITRNELGESINRMKNDKTPGEYGIAV